MSTVTSSRSVSPMLRPSRRSFSAMPPGSSRLSDSPCSSRSTIAFCNSRSRRSALSWPALASLASFRNSDSIASFTASAGICGRRRDRLERAALGDPLQQLVLVGRELAVGAHRRHQRVDDRGIEHAAAGGDLADRPDELVAVADAVLQQVGVAGRAVGQQRDRVLGFVVLRQHDDADPGVLQADEPGRLDALVLEARRHPDVGDEHVGRR